MSAGSISLAAASLGASSLVTSLESSVIVRFLPANAMAALAAHSVIAALSMIRALMSVT